MSNNNFVSIVLPCHNEEEVILSSYLTLKSIIDQLILENQISGYEIVMVNNGSTDATLNKMLDIINNDDNIVIIDLRSNYGYQGSISAGLYYAKGDVVITIDADLQDDPYKIPEMIGYYKQGFDMVLGVRNNRASDSFFKRFTANSYYKLLNLLGVNTIPNHGDFRLLSRSLVEEFKKMPERNRFIRGMILSLESKYATVVYDRKPRQAGKTKFKIKELFALALDGITSFTSAPIRIVTIFGFIFFLLSILGTLYVLEEKFIRKVDVPGWAFLSLLILFFGGVQSLFMGIIGEYIAKTYIETKKRPLFLIRKIYSKATINENNAN